MAMTFQKVLQARRSVRAFRDTPVECTVLDALCDSVLAATDGEGRRAVPSAHASYPLEIRAALGHVSGREAGLYRVQAAGWTRLNRQDPRDALQHAAVDDQSWIGKAAAVLTICGNAVDMATRFADQAPFGERGMRYLQLEAGAAAQVILMGAVDAGLGAVLVAGFRDDATAEVLGIQAPMVPLAHICVGMPQ